MLALLSASFRIIIRQFPSRALLKSAELSSVLGIYALTLVFAGLEMFAVPGGSPTSAGFISMIGLNIVGLLLVVALGRLLINRYVTDPFSFTEMLALDVLLSAGAQIIFSVSSLIASTLGTAIIAVLGIVWLIFGIYMLLTFQSAVSSIAGITKSQAAIVIVVPVLIVVLIWFAVGAFFLDPTSL